VDNNTPENKNKQWYIPAVSQTQLLTEMTPNFYIAVISVLRMKWKGKLAGHSADLAKD
jgi:hypothetical protein